MPKVVTCLLVHDNKLLILQRSNTVKTYKKMWGGVAGYIEPNEQPLETAYKEIFEETGLLQDQVKLIKQVTPVEFTDIYNDETYNWVIHPFMFFVEKKEKIQIDWEHTQYKWVDPKNINQFTTVPHFKSIVKKLLK